LCVYQPQSLNVQYYAQNANRSSVGAHGLSEDQFLDIYLKIKVSDMISHAPSLEKNTRIAQREKPKFCTEHKFCQVKGGIRISFLLTRKILKLCSEFRKN
jgi:hypothetical protein